MEDLYVVIDDKPYPDRVYHNENEYSTGCRIMNLEDAEYTAKLLGCKIYKLVALEDLL